MNKKTNLLALILLTGTLPLIAARPEPHRIAEDPCCPAPDPCAKCAQIWPTRGPDWIITPGAGPCVARGFDVYITVDFIYWTAREDHLGFAFKQTVDANNSVVSRGNVSQPDWNFRPGFKVGLGFMYNHDGWDAGANYTWFRGRNTKKSVTSDDVNTKNH